MRRAVIALAIVAGTTVPAVVASVWIFGCCALPFHLCRFSAMHGSAPQPITAPAAKPQSIALRAVMPAVPAEYVPADRAHLTPSLPAAYRSFITLGAVRCDRDVGLHTLLATFLI